MLTGYAQVGKDTFAKRLVEAHGFARVSFADPMREALYKLNPSINVAEVYETDAPKDCAKFLMARGSPIAIPLRIIIDHFGWDRAKVLFPEIRQLLQRFGTEVGREMFGDNFWVDQAIKKIDQSPSYRIVITDARFDNEVERIRQLYQWSAHHYLVKVIRPGFIPVNAHKSDAGLSEFLIDFDIVNDSSIDELNSKVDRVIEAIGLTKREAA